MGPQHHFGGVLYRVVLDLLEREGRLDDVLAAIPESRPLTVLRDDSTWHSYGELRSLLEAASAALGGPEALFRAGAEAGIADGNQPELTQLLQELGGLRALWLALGDGHAQITTIVEHDPIELGPTDFLIRTRLTDGFDPFAEWCSLSAGMIAMSPRIFGLSDATVVEETCQRRGDPWCAFRVRWREDQDPTSKASYYEFRARLYEQRFEALQRRVDDLVSGADLEAVLERIVEAASSSVRTGMFVLALDQLPGVGRRVLFRGVDEATAEECASHLLEPEAEPDPTILAADVTSSRRRYGRLAAIDPRGVGLPEERLILRSYARLAASALDSATALAESRAQAARATALLELSTELADLATLDEVAKRLVRAAPAVVGCDSAVIAFLEEGTDMFAVRAAAGFAPEQERHVLGVRVKRREIGPFGDIRHHELPTAPGPLAELMRRAGVLAHANVPLHVDGVHVGVLVAAVHDDPDRLRPTDELHARLTGLAGQAATAMRNARLVEHMQHQAMHDALTGLPNRSAVIDRVARMGRRGSALFIDLDGFKDVNDSLGHEAGDQLLCAVTDRLRLVIRDTDVLARLGGDEFVVLTESGIPEVLAERVLQVLRDPFVLEEHQRLPLRLSGSIGIARAGVSSGGDLLRDADVALYHAKASGKDCFAIYDPGMERAVRARMVLDAELSHAVEQRQLFLLYQPILDLSSDRIIGVEALLRWRHPERGVVAPNDFIPALESSGLIVDVGRWVLEEACRQAAEWYAAGLRLSVSVNVSARQLERDGLVDDVRAALNQSSLPPRHLTIEITETSIMRDPDASVARLQQIRALGVRVAVDDFGTGYSSLAYLRQFPIDVLKIDRSFVSGIGSSHEAVALMRMLVQLGKGLGLETLAEGIESEDQRAKLQEESCDLGQGFLFARPVEASAVPGLVRTSDPEGAADPVAMPRGIAP